MGTGQNGKNLFHQQGDSPVLRERYQIYASPLAGEIQQQHPTPDTHLTPRSPDYRGQDPADLPK